MVGYGYNMSQEVLSWLQLGDLRVGMDQMCSMLLCGATQIVQKIPRLLDSRFLDSRCDLSIDVMDLLLWILDFLGSCEVG